MEKKTILVPKPKGGLIEVLKAASTMAIEEGCNTLRVEDIVFHIALHCFSTPPEKIPGSSVRWTIIWTQRRSPGAA